MAKTIDTGIDWEAVRRELDSSGWEEDYDGGEQRLAFLGTCFALTPSGKYYMPWACSNVDACGTCGGKGTTGKIHAKRRVVRKWEHALERMRAVQVVGVSVTKQFNYARFIFPRLYVSRECPACGGVGSREAYLDELWREQLEREAEEHGLFVTGGEGDPCDIFAGESREREESEKEEVQA